MGWERPWIALEAPTAQHQPPIKRRSRTGCQTCKRRRVKCDERRDVCHNCTRLHLVCQYDNQNQSGKTKPRPIAAGRRRRRSSVRHQEPLISSVPPGAATREATSPVTSNSSVQGIKPIPAGLATPRNNATDTLMTDQPNGIGTATAPDGQAPVDLDAWDLGLLGDSSFWPHVTFGEPPDNNTVTQQTTLPFKIADSRPSTTKTPRPVPVTVTLGSGVTSGELTLLRHLADFAVPPILIGVEPRWNSARVSLLRLANSSPAVRHAICAFSALSFAGSQEASGKSVPSSAHYYELGLNEVRNILDQVSDKVDATTHEVILASVFFLCYVELTTTSVPTNTYELLRRAHSISNIGQRPSTVLGTQLRTWLKLLDAKVVSAGGDGAHLLITPDAQDLEGFEDGVSPVVNDQDADPCDGDEAAILETEDILYNSLNRLAYNFYLQVLTFSGRIAQLDQWHRSRGSVADEFKVMCAADKIVKDLGALWTRRPAIIDLADKGDQLRQHLSPELALKIEQNLRTYCANFYACYIHLQRVAYVHLPSTPQAKRALDKIIHLVRLSVIEGRTLSISMMWPLMMAGCDCEDSETREWIIQHIESMSGTVGNASRTAQLVREVVRKQLKEGKRQNARAVMQELFGTVFAII
ncbi:hypothetical protein VTN77DRAFT_9419 [Rasamsonia byssochlamydoides]|uniref:uncharacterized protein n=1 Tax=Rasamsonia byssochlamydoides TaxID=89139 RepID=UPI003743554A